MNNNEVQLTDFKIRKRDGSYADYSFEKVEHAIRKTFIASYGEVPKYVQFKHLRNSLETMLADEDNRSVEKIQDHIEEWLMDHDYYDAAKNYILYREQHKNIRNWVNDKLNFISRYKKSSNTANATIDDNSNVSNKNIGILNAEIHKPDNVQISRRMVVTKLRDIFPTFDSKQYLNDLKNHIIYKHDESSFAGAVAPYCVALTMYPFLTDGIKGVGGLSAKPKNLDSYCGMLVNMIFAISAQFAGAVAVPEALLYFDYFARKEWGDDYYLHIDDIVNPRSKHPRTIQEQIHQHFQQIIYSINQPSSARNCQSAFTNFAYFDKPFFESMFGEFSFPDYTRPIWESFNWLQRDFMKWFNHERTKCILTFPVESFALIYKDGKFEDEDSANFVAEEYAEGHSFFTYISDTTDSLSSCCRLKNAIQTKEFNFTNGNMGLQTGSKSVITLNLNRIIQDCDRAYGLKRNGGWKENTSFISQYLKNILDRVYKYHIAYNELLWDMKNAHLLPVYDAGFIDLNKQYLTIGINGLNQAAEFLGMTCDNNEDYKLFCKKIFSTISNSNDENKQKFNKHQITFNVEQVPAESLAIKNYNWDKEDGYWVPEDTNLYASYIFKPNDASLSVFDKIVMHSKEFASDELSGGQAAHLNLAEHLTKSQYSHILNFAGKVGCSYLTFNVPNCECKDCGYIAKQPFDVCPKCGGTHISLWDRIIGYLTEIKNWSSGRQQEQKTRVYEHV